MVVAFINVRVQVCKGNDLEKIMSEATSNKQQQMQSMREYNMGVNAIVCKYTRIFCVKTIKNSEFKIHILIYDILHGFNAKCMYIRDVMQYVDCVYFLLDIIYTTT